MNRPRTSFLAHCKLLDDRLKDARKDVPEFEVSELEVRSQFAQKANWLKSELYDDRE